MTLDSVSSIMTNAINVILLASAPSILIGVLAGLTFAIFQAVTQINEQTLSFVPKMAVMFIVLAMTFSWMSNLLINLALTLWKDIPLFAK
ncbi:EscS/YscS/HrcS family type III secretion system export apparatus protein [bacterium]|jgi:flagellar biosynthesis protein FliQ|nr:EscS/YscS/HrcS family type III secretion system export apparatus protein [bacterium]MBT3581308.1 EscS/YscS/HrcS family type III secretion system export apparatus protein [bacterium]MBT4552112.1 EscS/YscS/HrcS family type III secretion system export apparatus protein [bacterium]MBT5988637.1 EscS/YscS/HrcS family type III secretion system export apparatus protein [bacterium]MBT7088101.1 EscS/YscS/HrcS family type III secretion system export apparatus protein [bacterium]